LRYPRQLPKLRRGFLRDRGLVFPRNIGQLRRTVPQILEDAENGLTVSARATIAELFDFLREVDRRVTVFDRRIDEAFRASSLAQRIARIEGVGPKISTAVVAAVGDGRDFKNGRHMAAWLGLVPRQHSSGDRTQLFGISKRERRTRRAPGLISCANVAASTVLLSRLPTRMLE